MDVHLRSGRVQLVRLRNLTDYLRSEPPARAMSRKKAAPRELNRHTKPTRQALFAEFSRFFRSLLISQGTLRNLERKSCITVFPGSHNVSFELTEHLLLTASRRRQTAPLSEAFLGTCCGFLRFSSERGVKRWRNRVSRPPRALPTPNSPFSPVDRIRLLTGRFGLGSQVAGSATASHSTVRRLRAPHLV